MAKTRKPLIPDGDGPERTGLYSRDVTLEALDKRTQLGRSAWGTYQDLMDETGGEDSAITAKLCRSVALMDTLLVRACAAVIAGPPEGELPAHLISLANAHRLGLSKLHEIAGTSKKAPDLAEYLGRTYDVQNEP